MKKIFFLFFICLVLIFGLAFFLWSGIYLPKDKNAVEEKLFFIEQGKGVEEIAINLDNQGLIKHQLLFKFYVLVRGISPNLQTGVYKLSPSMSISEIVNKITTGDVYTKRITILEGYSIRQIEREFSETFNREMDFNQFYASDLEDQFKFLKDVPEGRGLEGFLFPDTYLFDYLVSEEEIIRTMLRNFDRKLTAEIREEIIKQEKSIYEIIIMASLLEKEVRILEDKKLVSDIFWRRIELNMPLQIDATIVYVLQGENWTFDQMRREVRANKNIDSLYNTYLNRGLPIGPISNPGINSILAAIQPRSNQYLFFLSTPEGETIFSRTYEQHKNAINRYLNAN